MITTKKGKGRIKGDTPEIIADLTIILKSFRSCVPNADKWIGIAVEDSKKSSEEIASEVKELRTQKGGAVNGTE
jgi:hypothetical protein